MATTHPTIQNPLGTEKIGRLLAKFAIPAIISMLVNTIYNIVDQVFIGRTPDGLMGIATTNVALPITTVCTATALLLGIGGAANFSLRLGEGKKDTAAKIAGCSIGLMVITGVALCALVLLLLDPLLYAFGAYEGMMEMARTYTAIIAPGIPFLIVATGACAIIRSDGSPRFAMAVMVAGAVFNLIFDPIFLFVFNMGIAGIALATTLGQVLSCAIAVYYLVRRMRTVKLSFSMLRPRAQLSKAICALGAGSCFNQLSMMVMQITMNSTLRHYGSQSAYGADIPMAAVGAITKLSLLFLSFTIGIGQGLQPIVGFNFGAKRYGRVKEACTKALMAASIVSMITFVAFQVFPAQLMMVFGQTGSDFLEFSVRFMRVFTFCIFAGGIQPVTANFFTGIGKARKGILISLTRQILTMVPLLLILPLFFGLDGVMYAGPFADGASALVSAVLIVVELRRITALHRQSQPVMVQASNG